MVFTFELMGLTPSMVIVKPPKSISSLPKMNLAGLNIIPFCAQ